MRNNTDRKIVKRYKNTCNAFYELVERQADNRGNYNGKAKVLANATNMPSACGKNSCCKVGATITIRKCEYSGSHETSGSVTQTTTTTATTTTTDTYATHYTDTTTDTYQTTYTDTTTDQHKETTTTTTERAKYRMFDGVMNWNFNFGDGKLEGDITARDVYVKINGGENNLVELIREDAAFANLKDCLDDVLVPEKYTGRASSQVKEFIETEVEPILAKHKDKLGLKGEILL